MTVDFAPSVTGNPTNATTNAGNNATFTATATGNPAPAVQWQVSANGGTTFTNVANGGDYSGGTTATLSITGAAVAMNGYQYQAVFSTTLLGAVSPSTATTTAAILTVDVAPSVTTNPTNQTVNAGLNTSFTAAATGNPNPTIQWLLSTNGGVTFSNVTNGGVYSGATSTQLTILGATASMNGYEYEAIFGNTLSGAGSTSTATTTAGTLTVDFASAVATNPTNQTVTAGNNHSFTASATGNPTPSVEWIFSSNAGLTFGDVTNGGVYSGATTSTLSITGATAAMNGYLYEAVFTNMLSGAGSGSAATTTEATLTVQYPPSITVNPSNASVAASAAVTGTATFTSQAAGDPAVAVQWQVSTNGGISFTNLVNNGNYSGATGDMLTVSGITLGMNGFQYRAVFSNGIGTPVPSTVAVLTAAYQSQYAGSAYLYTYYAYIYSFDAYISGSGSYTAFVDEYYAYVYAQNASTVAAYVPWASLFSSGRWAIECAPIVGTGGFARLRAQLQFGLPV